MQNKVSIFLNKNIAYIFLLPAVIFVFAMIVFPLVYNTWLSLSSWTLSNIEAPKFVGFANYIKLLSNQRFWGAVYRTLLFSVSGLLLQVFFGLVMALAVNRHFHGKKIFKTLLLVPMVMAPVAVAMIWLLILEPTIGLANQLLALFNIEAHEWLGSSKEALWALMLVDVWQWTPMVGILIIAALSSLPDEPYEAARIDGANSWQVLTKITLPLISSAILIAALLRLIDIVKTFDLIYATTQGGPDKATETINIYSYLLSFQYLRFGEAAATLMLFLVYILGLSFLMVKLSKKLVVKL